MHYKRPIVVVGEWQEAVNNRDINSLMSLSAPDIETIGPRGSGYGHALLRDWLSRAGLSFTPQRVFARNNVVVVAQHATWHSTETREAVSEAEIASCFRVAGAQVTQVARYDSLDAALEAGGLVYADEVTNI